MAGSWILRVYVALKTCLQSRGGDPFNNLSIAAFKLVCNWSRVWSFLALHRDIAS